MIGSKARSSSGVRGGVESRGAVDDGGLVGWQRHSPSHHRRRGSCCVRLQHVQIRRSSQCEILESMRRGKGCGPTRHGRLRVIATATRFRQQRGGVRAADGPWWRPAGVRASYPVGLSGRRRRTGTRAKKRRTTGRCCSSAPPGSSTSTGLPASRWATQRSAVKPGGCGWATCWPGRPLGLQLLGAKAHPVWR